jgi:hypothetical protein
MSTLTVKLYPHHLHCEVCAKEFTVETTRPWLDRPEEGWLCDRCLEEKNQ